MSKTVLITGASRGIGAATAKLAASQGWRIGVNYRSNEVGARQVVEQIEQNGGCALPIKGDVADEQQVLRMFDTCEAAFGPVDGLVNNAGILRPASLIKDMSLERWNAIFKTNVAGSFLCAREAIRRMTKAGNGGTIVNLSSMAAILGGAHEFVDYASSKGAIDALTIGLSRECARDGVRVNAVRPGLIETDMQYVNGVENRIDDLLGSVPMGRAGLAAEVAGAIIWLLGDAASYVNGATIAVTGGR